MTVAFAPLLLAQSKFPASLNATLFGKSPPEETAGPRGMTDDVLKVLTAKSWMVLEPSYVLGLAAPDPMPVSR
jgi:hypothetical protein